MNVIVIYSSPNDDGLTAACSAAPVEGAREAGADVEEVRLNDLDVGMCAACNNGWGTCRTAHECQVKDGFQALHARFCAADALVLVTPVYWGEMSEPAKAFADASPSACPRGRPPVVVDCHVSKEANCYPMIPSGAAHNEMLLGGDVTGDEISDDGKILV